MADIESMNIWMFNHYAITPDVPGGTRHFELGKNLAASGHHVVIFAANFIHMSFSFVPVDPSTGYVVDHFGNLDFVRVKTRGYRKNDWRRFANMADYCRAARQTALALLTTGQLQPPDVIIGSTVHPFAPVMAAKLARKMAVPFVYEIRDLWPQTFIDMGIWRHTSLQARFFKAVERWTVKHAKKIITLSPRTADYLAEQYHYDRENIIYIPNGVYTHAVIRSDSSAQTENETLVALSQLKAAGRFVVLFSGSMILSNRLDNIIDAAALLNKQAHLHAIQIVLIGKGKEEERYHDLIRQKGLTNITILAPVPKELVPLLLQQADALILKEGNVLWGSSNKLYDYMVSQRPIIATVFAKHNDIIGELKGGVSVPRAEGPELKAAIETLYTLSDQEKEAMGQHNLDYVKAHHDWELLAKRLEKALQSVGNES